MAPSAQHTVARSLDIDLAEQLRSAVGEFARVGKAATDELPAPFTETLGALTRDGSLSIADLARRRNVRHQSQSATVNELLALGHIRRTVDPADARGWLIEATPTGRDLILRLRTRRAEWIAEASESLDPGERAVLASIPAILHKLAGSGA